MHDDTNKGAAYHDELARLEDDGAPPIQEQEDFALKAADDDLPEGTPDPEYAAYWQAQVDAHYAGTVPESECAVCEADAPSTSEADSPAGWRAPSEPNEGPHGSRALAYQHDPDERQADPEFVRLEQQRADVARWAKAEAESDPAEGHAEAELLAIAERLTNDQFTVKGEMVDGRQPRLTLQRRGTDEPLEIMEADLDNLAELERQMARAIELRVDPEVGRSYRVVDLEGATTDSIFRVVKAIDEHEFEIAGDSTMTGAYQKEDLRYSIRRGLVVDVTDEPTRTLDPAKCEFCHGAHWLQTRRAHPDNPKESIFEIGHCFACDEGNDHPDADRDALRRFRRGGPVYVNVVEHGRNYGGPEEGGWWYDTETPLFTLTVEPRWAEQIADGLRTQFDERNYGVWVQPFKATPKPTTRPHYE